LDFKPAESPARSGSMNHTLLCADWREQVVFAQDGPKPQKLLETTTFRAVLVGLEAGQRIPPHPAPASAYYVLEGTGWMIVDGERLAMRPGTIISMPDGAVRGVEAETRLAFLGTQAA
jgi:quercetin dioxygenase-like cupin family protein